MSNLIKFTSLIISPSGGFYGSEQVLVDYLSASSKHHTVAVKRKGELYSKLSSMANIQCISFNSVRFFYLRVAFECLIKRVKSVYLNEAGHSKYVLLLARFFPKTNFIIHIRLLEDTNEARWPSTPGKNLKVFVVSEFLQQHLFFQSTQLYDPYLFSDKTSIKDLACRETHVAVIGRITFTKGLSNVLQLLRTINERGTASFFVFHFFGEVSSDIADSDEYKELCEYSNVVLEGYIDTQDIFRRVHCVLHAATDEPLGRVFLDALNYHLPFIGINRGGIGEIARQLNLQPTVINATAENTGPLLYDRLISVMNNYSAEVKAMAEAKGKAREIFSVGNYATHIDLVIA